MEFSIQNISNVAITAKHHKVIDHKPSTSFQ